MASAGAGVAAVAQASGRRGVPWFSLIPRSVAEIFVAIPYWESKKIRLRHHLGVLTLSLMPPTAEATTAVWQAMASRLMMPNGSETDGQQNTAAGE